MNKDYHLNATFLAAYLAGYSLEDSKKIAFSAQKVDDFGEDRSAVCHTVTSMEGKAIRAFWDAYIADKIDQIFDISDTWMTFHFIPRRQFADIHGINNSKVFACGDGEPMRQVCDKAADGTASLTRLGITMHVLADSYAHQGYCGVVCYNPRIAQNLRVKYADYYDGLPALPHVPVWASSGLSGLFYFGHGSAGHVPDLSWAKYYYDWKYDVGSGMMFRDNPLEFDKAFRRMTDVLTASRKGRAKESNPVYTVGTVSQYLQDEATRIQIERSNIIDWNAAICQARGKVPPEILEAYDFNESLDDDERALLEKIKAETIPVRKMTTYGHYETESVKIGLLLEEDIRSLPLDVESDTLFARLFDSLAERQRWQSAKSLDEEYADYLRDKSLDAEFTREASGHKSAVYSALCLDKGRLHSLLVAEFSDIPRMRRWFREHKKYWDWMKFW